MRKYCKAYPLKDLRQFPNWHEQGEAGEEKLPDDTIVYLWDDFTVVRSPIVTDKGILWTTVTPAWQEFCQAALQFAVPEDLRYAYDQTEQ